MVVLPVQRDKDTVKGVRFPIVVSMQCVLVDVQWIMKG